VKTHEHSAANAPQEQWRLHLLLLAAIEFAKLGSSEREAAKKAHALLKECEKLLQEEGTTVSKPVSAKTKRKPILLNAGPIPPEPAFKEYFGDKYVPWKEAIVAITGDNRLDRAEDKFGMFLKDLGLPPARGEQSKPTTPVVHPPVGTFPRRPLALDAQALTHTLANLKENGFPPGQVESYREQFLVWWQREKSEKRSESGRKSASRRKLEGKRTDNIVPDIGAKGNLK
jgi:hypothetical protein